MVDSLCARGHAAGGRHTGAKECFLGGKVAVFDAGVLNQAEVHLHRQSVHPIYNLLII